MLTYFVLFISAFGAATILPFYSEITFIAMLNQSYNVGWVWFVATLGNTLGAAVNWILGRYMLKFESRRWFPFKISRLHRAQHWFQRYGVWSLLFAWLPIGGDALTFIAGIMKVRFSVFIVLTAIGKGVRYLMVIGFYYGYLNLT